MKIINSSNSISIEEIRSFENKIKYKLPNDYVDFLLKNNGGEPELGQYETLDGKTKSWALMFLPLSHQIKENLYSKYKEYTIENNRILPSLLPIIQAPAEFIACISLAKDDYGYVYHWNHDWENNVFTPSYDHMALVAKSFTDFVNSLF